jgi:hypothetical protein
MTFVRNFQEKTLNPLKKWYYSPLITDNGSIYENGRTLTHGDFIETVANDIDEILEKHFYIFQDKEDFLTELTEIIYSFSDNS